MSSSALQMVTRNSANIHSDTSITRQRTHHVQLGSARFRHWRQTPFGAWRRVLSQPFQIEGRHQFGNAVGVAKCPRDMEAAVEPSHQLRQCIAGLRTPPRALTMGA